MLLSKWLRKFDPEREPQNLKYYISRWAEDIEVLENKNRILSLDPRNDIPAWAIKKIEKLKDALRNEYILTPNDHFCKGCGTSWALGSPHEHHEEECPLHKNNWALEKD